VRDAGRLGARHHVIYTAFGSHAPGRRRPAFHIAPWIIAVVRFAPDGVPVRRISMPCTAHIAAHARPRPGITAPCCQSLRTESNHGVCAAHPLQV